MGVYIITDQKDPRPWDISHIIIVVFMNKIVAYGCRGYLRLCFRIISPSKTYTLQADNEADRMDWVHKITGVITSLFNFQFLQQPHYGKLQLENIKSATGSSLTSQQEDNWASLNLGILLCIECYEVHDNFGVHISKVRSITLDVRVWEPTMLELFNNLGNTYCNSIWEGLLLLGDERVGESNVPLKPCSTDPSQYKEKYIQAKVGVTGNLGSSSCWAC
ncbi:ADP-ribosylation factor GTPase-activating protein agd4 [Trifolium repens]|nr:ADP-ribosylation factor GTPase-activating protein agd4 [Trifolium repens]